MVYVDSTHESIRISTDETDKREITTNENSPTMRSYDCTFCKRGFTNAQALGGHMNIHRKDKAKAKKLRESTVAHKAFQYFSPISNEQAQLYASLRANKSYQICASSQNTNFSHVNSPQSASHRDLLNPYGDFMGLKLKLGLPISEERREEFIKREEHGEINWFGNEQVDLELRLGQNPY